jgi:endoglucanase
MQNSSNDHRVYWYEEVRKYLQEKGIAWTSWDYHGGFGLFEVESNEMFEHDLNVPLVEALGFTAPEQTEFVLLPDRTGFDVYTDYIAEDVQDASYRGPGTLDFYCDVAPAVGAYCIYCTGFDRYNLIGFDFRPDRDLTELAQRGYLLEFWVRGDTPGARFEVRFLDSKTADPQDHPWRMASTIDQSIAPWDSAWHRVQIPLRNFVDRGSWDDNTWFLPRGAFDWSAVSRFEIVAEYHSLVGMQFWFDEIRVAKPPGAR